METDDERAARGAGLASTVRALSAVVLVLNSLFCALVSSDCLMSRSTWLCLLAEGVVFTAYAIVVCVACSRFQELVAMAMAPRAASRCDDAEQASAEHQE